VLAPRACAALLAGLIAARFIDSLNHETQQPGHHDVAKVITTVPVPDGGFVLRGGKKIMVRHGPDVAYQAEVALKLIARGDLLGACEVLAAAEVIRGPGNQPLLISKEEEASLLSNSLP
jgi:hypothetical protein